MATLYGTNAGYVFKLPFESAPAFINLSEINNFRIDSKMIATSFRLDRSQMVQSLKSLRNIMYTYAFGEVPVKLVVGGYFFLSTCNAGSVSKNTSISLLNDFYEKNNIYSRREALDFTIGQVYFKGFLENMSLAGENNPYNWISFSFGFMIIPKDSQPPGSAV